MKSYKEFVSESAGASGDHHAEAAKILKKHASDCEDTYVHGGEHPDGHKLHLGGVHHEKVHKLHAALEGAGFKKHAAAHEPEHGAATGGGGDGKVYHKFTKGKTSVNVSHKPLVSAVSDHYATKADHHFAEVHSTVKHPLAEEVLDESTDHSTTIKLRAAKYSSHVEKAVKAHDKRADMRGKSSTGNGKKDATGANSLDHVQQYRTGSSTVAHHYTDTGSGELRVSTKGSHEEHAALVAHLNQHVGKKSSLKEDASKSFADFLGEAVEVDHSAYQRSHGKKAGGTGNHIISLTKDFDAHNHKEGEHYVSHNGPFAEAVKKAKALAKTKGALRVYPQP